MNTHVRSLLHKKKFTLKQRGGKSLFFLKKEEEEIIYLYIYI